LTSGVTLGRTFRHTVCTNVAQATKIFKEKPRCVEPLGSTEKMMPADA